MGRISEEEWQRRRRALEAEAAALGLNVSGYGRRHGVVDVRLEAEEVDVDHLVLLLERRGIVLGTRSEQARAEYGKRIKQYLSVDLDHPSHQVDDAGPGRRLWTDDTAMVRWVGQLLAFEDAGEWCGYVEAPWPRTPRKGSLPAPLLDSNGREIGRVLEAEVVDDKLVVGGVIADTHLHALMAAPHLESLLAVQKVKDPAPSFGRPDPGRHRMRSDWLLPAVRLTTKTPTTFVRLLPDDAAETTTGAADVAAERKI